MMMVFVVSCVANRPAGIEDLRVEHVPSCDGVHEPEEVCGPNANLNPNSNPPPLPSPF